VITICYINGESIVYEGEVSQEDRLKIEALFPYSEIHWEVKPSFPGMVMSKK